MNLFKKKRTKAEKAYGIRKKIQEQQILKLPYVYEQK